MLVATGSSTAGIITASSALFIAVAGAITALTTLIPLLRRSKSTEAKVDEVHTIVNQQRTDMQNYNAALVRALSAAGIEVPVDQSVQQQ